MKIAILNYIDGSVEIVDTDLSCLLIEEVESWLEKHDYDLSSICWMGDVKEITFKDLRNE